MLRRPQAAGRRSPGHALPSKRAPRAGSARTRRRTAAAIVALAVLAVAVSVGLSGSGSGSTHAPAPHSAAARAAVRRVETLLAGLPQQAGNVLGRSVAPVTVTVYSDLQCSACAALDLAAGVTNPAGVTGSGVLDALIASEVATGRIRLVYKSLETATAGGPTAGMWITQQAAVNAAGLQRKGWDYVELFYNEQGAEGTAYVTMPYLIGLARQIPGLDYARWLRDLRSDRTVRAAVAADNAEGTRLDEGRPSTPTIWVSGPRRSTLFRGLAASPTAATAAIEAAIRAAA